MPDRVHIGLDNPVFRGRLRQPVRSVPPQRAIGYRQTRSSHVKDVVSTNMPVVAKPKSEIDVTIDQRVQFENFTQSNLEQPQATAAKGLPGITNPQSFVEPARSKQQRSHVLRRQLVQAPNKSATTLLHNLRDFSKLQLVLVSMACFVFTIGVIASVQGFQANHIVAAQVSILSNKSKSPTTTDESANAVTVPSTTKPAAGTLSQYVVAPNLPRYLKIPKLGVDARILQVGVTETGALGTPDNIYDTAWYTSSAKPGQPGATLIDGHVSSWTAHGVFYGIKTLVAGNMIQIVRGDGAVFNYKVVKTQIYGANNVDMQAAMTPIVPGTPGLNLITCTGNVEPGTSLFNERVIVFAQQV
jgi:sortase (surface protein transpeptidase)